MREAGCVTRTGRLSEGLSAAAPLVFLAGPELLDAQLTEQVLVLGDETLSFKCRHAKIEGKYLDGRCDDALDERHTIRSRRW